MTDETREQIEAASIDFANKHPVSHGTYYDRETSFRAGATHQHPIAFSAGEKSGWNKAVDAMKSILEHNLTFFSEPLHDYQRGEVTQIKYNLKELEALRK